MWPFRLSKRCRSQLLSSEMLRCIAGRFFSNFSRTCNGITFYGLNLCPVHILTVTKIPVFKNSNGNITYCPEIIVSLLFNVCIAVFTLEAGLLARSQCPEGPATGHLDTGFSWFPCVYKQMLRWFPRFQVATTCFSCSPPDLYCIY